MSLSLVDQEIASFKEYLELTDAEAARLSYTDLKNLWIAEGGAEGGGDEGGGALDSDQSVLANRIFGIFG